MKRGLSIPYMGSKRKLAPRIVDLITKRHPEAKNFYDLFGGGGSVSFEASLHNQFESVHYNEIDTGVVGLLKKVLCDGVTDEFYRWISYEEFHGRKTEDSWVGGLIKTCWSFGNRGATYIYGLKVVEDKKQLHDLVVNRMPIDGLDIHPDIMSIKNVQDRRLAVMRVVKSFSTGRVQLEHLERINRLQHLENINRFSNISITNKSALDFSGFSGGDVLYLDPPYMGTTEYQNVMCHNEFKKFVLSVNCPVYVSSYHIDWLECVAEFDHKSTLAHTKNNKNVVERLYYKP